MVSASDGPSAGAVRLPRPGQNLAHTGVPSMLARVASSESTHS